MNQQERPRRVMVLLVGGRLTPNFIGVHGYRPDAIECLVSEDERKKYDDVLEVVAPLDGIALPDQPHFVPAFDMDKITEACESLVKAHPGAEIIFNVTCATKVMAIAAYEVAKQTREPATWAIYVDTAHGRFLNLSEPGERPIPIQIGLEDYLNFYGRRPEKTFSFDDLSTTEAEAIAASVYLAEAGVAGVETLQLMRSKDKGGGRRTVRIKLKRQLKPEQWQVLHTLSQLGLLSNLKQSSDVEISYLIANNHDWNFINGTWLEVYVWQRAKERLDDQERPLFEKCGFSFEIPGPEGARKEIDVGCMYQGQLLHCSCKSEQGPFRTAYLDELRTVSSLLGGRFCSRLFVTNAYPPTEGRAGWRDYKSFLLQARDRAIVVVTGEELANIGAIWEREAKKPTFWRI